MATRLQQWLKAASPQEKKALTKHLGVTYAFVWQLAQPAGSAYSRIPNEFYLRSIEKFTSKLHKESAGRLPKVVREDMHPMCANCPYTKCNKRG
jgi:hypothetical protein